MARRLVRLGQRRLGIPYEDFPLQVQDVAEAGRLPDWTTPGPIEGRALRVAWISTPPQGGSGGHTTMFRMIEGLEQAGHHVDLYLYSGSGGDMTRQEVTVRSYWPGVKAAIRSAADPTEADVWIATSWPTAHFLASHPELHGHRMYFVQDFEPYFYPRGYLYTLAQETYGFGFTGITAGSWLSSVLSRDFGMRCVSFEFGADTAVYAPKEHTPPRDGVVLYVKPLVARRGHELGVLALSLFAQRHPEASIHVFGDPAGDLPFPCTDHGRLSPPELNALYNTCRVGLSLSYTNVSLIPWELLASGVVPVVNDAEHNRQVLRNEHVRWSASSPRALAEALSTAWERYDVDVAPRLLAGSVAGLTWVEPARSVTSFIEQWARAGGDGGNRPAPAQEDRRSVKQREPQGDGSEKHAGPSP